ncbi:MAG: chemotaxis protein CheY, partial [Candidatus Parcubacteria bacterium]|nr:chemotaxis protein CheY [Candidatus Parcubacteria bacterium]
MKVPKILIVEDDPQILDLTCEAFKRSGLEIIEATSGLDGFEKFRLNMADIDILLTDIDCACGSSFDGLALAKEVKKYIDAHSLQVSIFFMSGGRTYSDEELSRYSQFPLVKKPFIPRQL